MDLNEYLTEHRITQSEFAARLNVDQATISRLVRRTHLPSLKLAVAIERETLGKVLATCWIQPGSLDEGNHDAA